jgi:hypothetical protein
LGEKDAKGASGGIADAVLGVWAFFAMIGQVRDLAVQDALEVIEV